MAGASRADAARSAGNARILMCARAQTELRRIETMRIMKNATPPPFLWEGINYLRKVRLARRSKSFQCARIRDGRNPFCADGVGSRVPR